MLFFLLHFFSFFDILRNKVQNEKCQLIPDCIVQVNVSFFLTMSMANEFHSED